MEDNVLLVGMDIGEQVTQINCFDFDTFEPVPLSRDRDDIKKYEIPTGLCIDSVTGEFFWLDDDVSMYDQIIKIEYLLSDVKHSDTITVGEVSLDSYHVFKRFVVKVLSLLIEYYPERKIAKLVITLEDKDEKIVSFLKRIAREVDFSENILTIQNHRQSYMYYALSQPKELCHNSVGLFELNGNRLMYSQINIDRKTHPFIVGVETKDLSGDIEWDKLQVEDGTDISYAFLNSAGAVLHKQYVTTVYVTGKGFEAEWANDALRQLCNGRRVFRGQNLFSRGACYAARELSGLGKLKDYIFLDEEMVSCDIFLKLYTEAVEQDVSMVKAGSMWSDVDVSVDVIPDNEDEIQIIVMNVLKHEARAHMLSLSGFSGRENKTTRFTIRMRFADKKTCIVTLKDNGFGEICPASNRVWERYINIE